MPTGKDGEGRASKSALITLHRQARNFKTEDDSKVKVHKARLGVDRP
jgi:hypothetical protein